MPNNFLAKILAGVESLLVTDTYDTDGLTLETEKNKVFQGYIE